MKIGEYIYNSKFGRNVLIAGRTECGKERRSINNFFGEIKNVEWV